MAALLPEHTSKISFFFKFHKVEYTFKWKIIVINILLIFFILGFDICCGQ